MGFNSGVNSLMQGRVQFAIELRASMILIEENFLKCHCVLSEV